MKKEDIINLWKSVGWNTLNDYHNHINSTTDRIIFKELDPDEVDPKEFWKASDEHFSVDPVCNHNNILHKKLSISESNKLNYNIALYTGMIGQTTALMVYLENKMDYVSIAEIGCGYGSFYESFFKSCEHNPDYRGFDIIPRTPYALEIEGKDGTFSANQVLKYSEKFNLFFSSNTFQHLSKNQIRNYLRQIYYMLPYDGYFNVMYSFSEETYHYGQVIKMYSIEEFEALVKYIGFSVIGSASIEIPNSLTPCSLILKK
jgi:hypothetical protein